MESSVYAVDRSDSAQASNPGFDQRGSTMAKRIGVLTGGGDAPGQNVCLKAITYHAIDHGWEVIGIRKGWEGLLNFDPDNPSTRGDNTIELTKLRVRDIDRTASRSGTRNANFQSPGKFAIRSCRRRCFSIWHSFL